MAAAAGAPRSYFPRSFNSARGVSAPFQIRYLGQSCGVGYGVVGELFRQIENSLPLARVRDAEKGFDQMQFLASLDFVVHGRSFLPDGRLNGAGIIDIVGCSASRSRRHRPDDRGPDDRVDGQP
jgi:hypothetical protein